VRSLVRPARAAATTCRRRFQCLSALLLAGRHVLVRDRPGAASAQRTRTRRTGAGVDPRLVRGEWRPARVVHRGASRAPGPGRTVDPGSLLL